MSAPGFASAGDLGTESERLHLAERFQEAGVSTQRFVDVENGEKRTFDHTQRAPDDPALSGNYGIYAGRGGDDRGLWLVELDVDDYDEDGIDPDGLEAVEAISAGTLAIESPHTSEENPGHRLVAVTDENGEYVDVADALKREFGVMNPAPSWGEVRVKNQMTVGPGSQIDSGEYGCSKDWCSDCETPYGGRYRIARNEAIATITIEELVETIRADADIDSETVEQTSRTQASSDENGAADPPTINCEDVTGLENKTVTNKAGLALDDLRSRDGEEKLDALLTELNPEAFDYPSRSEGDFATASLLWHRGFPTDDIARILRHYRSYSSTQSDDYLARTIGKATAKDQRAFDLTDKYRPSVDTEASSPTLAVRIDDSPPSELWNVTARDDAFQSALVRSVINLAEGLTNVEFDDRLREIGVNAMNGEFAYKCQEFVDGGDPWDLVRVASEFGQAQRWKTRGLHAPVETVADGPLAVIAASEIDLPVRIEIGQSFRERNTTHRRTICQVIDAIATAATTVNIAFEEGPADLRQWLFVHHREDLPTLVETSSVRKEVAHPPLEQSVRTRAQEVLEADLSRTHWRVLKAIEATRGSEVTYHELANHERLPVSCSRVRVVLGELADLKVVHREGPRDRRRASLTPIGEHAIDLHDSIFGRESTISEFGGIADETGERPPKCSSRIRVSPATSRSARRRNRRPQPCRRPLRPPRRWGR